MKDYEVLHMYQEWSDLNHSSAVILLAPPSDITSLC